MNRDRLDGLLAQLERGEIARSECIEALARLPFRELTQARLDTHRATRQGIPEVVLGEGKSAEQIIEIAAALREEDSDVLVTRVSVEQARAVRVALPELVYDADARLLTLRHGIPPPAGRGVVLVVTAGTADLPVAHEAAGTAEFFGNKVERLSDVGVAGLHRLLASIDLLRRAHVLIVVAGMEGALPSVVAGLVERPVIAVPTSIGYGAHLRGVTALLSMLNSCSPNVATVNIDNGFGAAYMATLINRG